MPPTLGIVGTLVWDRIVPADPQSEPVEDWGGIVYAIAGALAALPAAWNVRPLVRIGRDAADEARALLGDYPRLDRAGIEVVPEANNRVELRYRDHADRTEILGGGVSPWSGRALAGRAAGCDALLVNFVSGHELGLEDFEGLRRAYRGPMYVDLHSLFLGIDEHGARVPSRLDEWRRWCACADAVQMNEHEFGLFDGPGDPAARMAAVLEQGPALVLVTRGERGVRWLGTPEGGADPARWRVNSKGPGSSHHDAERGRPREVTVSPVRGDPTGCGDVWGAALFARLLAGDAVSDAIGVANRLATSSVAHTGTSGLLDRLRAETP